MDFLRRIFFALYSLLFPRSYRRMLQKERAQMFQFLYHLCQTEYEYCTCKYLKQQVINFEKQFKNSNYRGCLFAVNTMLGLRDRIQNNDNLLQCMRIICKVHIAILHSAGYEVCVKTTKA